MSTLLVDALQDNGAGAVTLNSDLTLAAGKKFTSVGIDDNAVANVVTIDDSAADNFIVAGKTKTTTLEVTGLTAIGGALDVTGTLSALGDLTVTGSLIVNDPTVINDTLAVSGTLTGNAIITSGAVAVGTNLTVSGESTVEKLTINGALFGVPTIKAWWRGTIKADTSVGVIDDVADVTTTSSTTGLTVSVVGGDLKIIYPDITANPCVQVTCIVPADVVSTTIVTLDTEALISFPALPADATARNVHIAIIAGDV